jgi:hypothetical protein
MQKYLEDLSCQAGVVPEWKSLLRDLDRLQQVRVRHRGNDWVVRTDVAKPIADLFRHAHIAMPPRAKQMAPPKLVTPHEIRPETSRSPQAWCHVIANFAESRLISMPCKTQVFKSG